MELDNIAKKAVMCVCPDENKDEVMRSITDVQSAMSLVLNALPQILQSPEMFRSYKNKAVLPETEGLIYQWGNIRVVLHSYFPDTKGMLHVHHVSGNETAPIGALQLKADVPIKSKIAHRVADAHGGAYFFAIDNVWDEKNR